MMTIKNWPLDVARFQSAKTLESADVLSGWGQSQLKGGGGKNQEVRKWKYV